MIRIPLPPIPVLLGLTATLFSVPITSTANEPSWRQFRGPTGMGIAESATVTTDLDSKSNLQWRTTLTGAGWSSPVTDGQRIWVTSAVSQAASAEEKAAKLADVQFSQIKDVVASVELFAQCIDAQSGKVLIEQSLGVIDDPNPIHPMNSFASPTPLLTNDRVVCHFGSYGTWCLDAKTGETLWKQRLLFDDSVGPGSSPVLADDKVILVCDGIDVQFVAALDLSSGTLAWKTPRPPMRSPIGEFQKAYSTPLLIDVAGKSQLVTPGAQWIVAYDPATGSELWKVDHGRGFSTTPMPIYVGGLVLFATGYTKPELVAVDPTGQGDVTQTHVRWRVRRGVPAKPSPVSDGKLIYMVSDDGIISAVSLADGSLLWQKRVGGTYSASPLLSGENVFIGNHEGELTIFRTGDSFQKVNEVDFGEQIMASPVPINDDLLIRTKEAVYRFKG